MLLHLLAAAMLILSGAFCGAYYSEKLKNRVRICTDAERLLRICAAMIRSSRRDIFNIIKALKSEGLSELGFLFELPEEYSADCDVRNCWRNALIRDRSIPAEEKAVLTELGQILGTTDAEGQLSGIASLLVRMEELREQRREEYLRKGKLYRSLGVMAGVSVGIILI